MSGVGRERASLMKAALAMGTALALAAATPRAATTSDSYRSATENAGEVRGPLSDFWFKVRSEWSGYLKTETGPGPGGGAPRRRTLATPPPNRGWVSLVYGGLEGPLAHLFDEFLSEWKRAEGRNWPYAQIYDRRWDKMGHQGLKQNIIMIGTPASLPMVEPLAKGLGFNIAPGRIDIGKRKYRGDNLILIFIAPNPQNADKYALVITGSNDEALMQAGHLPYGETDYVLFRGRRLLESGFFAKQREAGWSPPESYQAVASHRGFEIRESAHYAFWYEPDRLPQEELDTLVAEKEAGYPGLVSLVSPAASAGRLTYYLYSSVDRKIDETSRDDVVHLDLAGGEIHAVYSRLEQLSEPYLDLMLLLHRAIGPTRVPRLERALAIALAPRFQGQDVATMAARAFAANKGKESAALKALRDQDVMTPADGPPSAHDILLAGFLRELAGRLGKERVFSFVSRASPRRLDESFRGVYRQDLGDALEEWAEALRAANDAAESARASSRAGGSTVDHAPDVARPDVASGLELLRRREDTRAIQVLEEALKTGPGDPTALAALSRARFRRSEFAEAERAARRAIEVCSGARPPAACAEAEGWGRLTLGRVEALRGQHVAARLELTHPAVTRAARPVPILADHWLATMGQSRNQLTVVSHLKREAGVSLRKLDWDAAEAGLRKAVEIDPTDGEAHRKLSEVYHKHHEYWAWQVRYLNEIHPDYTVVSRLYLPGESTPITIKAEELHTIDSFNDLVLKGNLELLKAQSLYAVEIQNLHAEGDRLLLADRDPEAALKVYLRALELNEGFFLSHFLVGRCYFVLERLAAAKESFEETLRRKPGDSMVLAWTHNYLGYIALHEDDLPEAKRSFRKALSWADEGKVGRLAREGLGRVDTIRLLLPGAPPRD